MSEQPSFYQQQLDPLSALAINAVAALNGIVASSPAAIHAFVRAVSEPSAAYWATYQQQYLYQLEVPPLPSESQFRGPDYITESYSREKQLEEYRQKQVAYSAAEEAANSEAQLRERVIAQIREEKKAEERAITESHLNLIQAERQLRYTEKQARIEAEKQYRVRMGFER